MITDLFSDHACPCGNATPKGFKRLRPVEVRPGPDVPLPTIHADIPGGMGTLGAFR